MTIAFTGATGQLGGLVAQDLLARTSPDQLVALARDTAKDSARALSDRGVEVRAFDYDAPGALAPALEGVDRLLLISGNAVGRRLPQHRAVIDAAAQAGVGFVAYTSFLHTDTARIIAVAPEHQETERLLAAAPFDVALLRNGWYTENYADTARRAARSGDLLTSAGDGRISSATRRDYAQAAAVVLTAPEAKAGTYELSGDTAWTQQDLAAAVSELSGRPVTVRNVSSDEHRALLTESGLPQGAIDFAVSTDRAIAAGELEDPAPGVLAQLIGRPTTTLREALAPLFA
jgi:NAD(P)H dehydrogenase (quinone)